MDARSSSSGWAGGWSSPCRRRPSITSRADRMTTTPTVRRGRFRRVTAVRRPILASRTRRHRTTARARRPVSSACPTSGFSSWPRQDVALPLPSRRIRRRSFFVSRILNVCPFRRRRRSASTRVYADWDRETADRCRWAGTSYRPAKPASLNSTSGNGVSARTVTQEVLSKKRPGVTVRLVCKDRGKPTPTEVAKFSLAGGLRTLFILNCLGAGRMTMLRYTTTKIRPAILTFAG